MKFNEFAGFILRKMLYLYWISVGKMTSLQDFPLEGYYDMKMCKIPVFCLLLVFAGTSVFALDIKGKAPGFSFKTGLGGLYDGFIDYDLLNNNLKANLKDGFDLALDEINDMVGDIDDKPEKFIQAFGNSSVYSSEGATQRGYAGYKLFAFTTGSMVGIQIPSSPFTIADEIDNLADKINKEKDLALGFNPQVASGQLSINTSEFLVKNLYLGLRFGYMNLNSLMDDLEFKTMNFGLVANYQLVPQKRFAKGFFLWRGLNLGTGFIYQGTKISYKHKLDTIEQDITTVEFDAGIRQETVDLGMELKPSLNLDIDITTFTVPVELTTSVRLLWFLNLPLGFGFDVGFGKSDMRIGLKSDINVKVNDSSIDDIEKYLVQDTPGNLSVKAGGEMAPQIFNLKLMSGLGISVGPIVLDIPVSWYFLDNGFSAGVTFGVVW